MASGASLKKRVREAAKTSARTGILEAAEATFAADGVAGASMQAIAARAGTSVGTLYNYFEDRDALVRALFEERRRRLGDSIDAALAPAAPFRTKLERAVRAVLAHFDAHRAFLAVALSTDVTPPLKKSSAGEVLRDRVRALVDAGVREGVLDPRRAHLSALALSGLLRAVLIDGVAGRNKPYVELVDDIVALFLRGAEARQ